MSNALIVSGDYADCVVLCCSEHCCVDEVYLIASRVLCAVS